MMSKYGSCSAHACTHCTYRPGHRFRCFDIMRAPPSPSTAVAWSRVEVHAALHGRTYMPGTGVRPGVASWNCSRRAYRTYLPSRRAFILPIGKCTLLPDRSGSRPGPAWRRIRHLVSGTVPRSTTMFRYTGRLVRRACSARPAAPADIYVRIVRTHETDGPGDPLEHAAAKSCANGRSAAETTKPSRVCASSHATV
jgi:hypothetical protein